MANEEAQKRYLRKHYAEQDELSKDDQWSKDGIGRLSYYVEIEEAKLQDATSDRPTDDGLDRDPESDADRTDRDRFPF